jgi:hypothetical protein
VALAIVTVPATALAVLGRLPPVLSAATAALFFVSHGVLLVLTELRLSIV